MSETLHVLIVDDNDAVRRSLSKLLRALGHKALVATGGEQGVDVLRTHHVDVVLMDLAMPGLSGEALYHVIISERPDLAHRVVVITGNPNAHDWMETQNLPVLAKPFDSAEMQEVLRTLVARRRHANGG